MVVAEGVVREDGVGLAREVCKGGLHSKVYTYIVSSFESNCCLYKVFSQFINTVQYLKIN